MAVKKLFFLMFAFACASESSNADQSDIGSLLLTENQKLSTMDSYRYRSTNNNRYIHYYLVNDAEAYSGDSLNFGRRQYQLSLHGVESAGRYFLFGDLLLLWNWQAGSYELLNVDAIEPGVWKSCWGQEVESVRMCGEHTELVYIFADENAAIEFDNPRNTDDEHAMGPEPEPTQLEPEPEPEPTQPDPETEPTQPDPEPEPTQPEPVPEPTQPDPEPEPTQPDPEPEPTQPEPEPEPTQPEPEPEPTQPASARANSTRTRTNTARKCCRGKMFGNIGRAESGYPESHE